MLKLSVYVNRIMCNLYTTCMSPVKHSVCTMSSSCHAKIMQHLETNYPFLILKMDNYLWPSKNTFNSFQLTNFIFA